MWNKYTYIKIKLYLAIFNLTLSPYRINGKTNLFKYIGKCERQFSLLICMKTLYSLCFITIGFFANGGSIFKFHGVIFA